MKFLLVLLTLTLSIGNALAQNAASAPQQDGKQVELKGTVLDEDKNPLPGVYVFVESTSIYTTTDNEGKFTMNLPAGFEMIVTFSFLGFESHYHIFEGNADEITVTMQEDETMLDDVVVVGYGSRERRSLSSSIASLDKHQLEVLAPTSNSLDNMLAGTVKGVLIRPTSGQPGAIPVINVRGITSPIPKINNSQISNIPLFVIDGVPIYLQETSLNPLLAISPNDIESIDVLKDAAATAIYGSRGANGVILVKTKSGRKTESLEIQAGYTFSVGNPIKRYKVLNRTEFMNLQDEVLRNTVDAVNSGTSLSSIDVLSNYGLIDEDPDTYQMVYNGLNTSRYGNADTDWVRATQNKNAQTHQYNMSARGGTHYSAYSFSFNGINQEGLFIKDNFERYGVRFSLDLDLSERFKMGTILNYGYASRNSGQQMDGFYEDRSWNARPDLPVYTETGALQRIPDYTYGGRDEKPNPVALFEKTSKFKSHQIFGNFYTNYQIIKGLNWYTDFNMSYNRYDNSFFTPLDALVLSPWYPREATLSISDFSNFNSSINTRLDYALTVNNHNFTAMAGLGSDRVFNQSKSNMLWGFPNDKYLQNPGSAGTLVSMNDTDTSEGLNSVYSRFTYNFDHRYLAEVAWRADQSSKFGPGNRWGTFPALSLAWRINNEKFMSNTRNVDDLKLRLSTGKTGSTNIPDFSYRQYIQSGGSNTYGEELTLVLRNTLPNENIRWEMTTEYNAGIDFSLWQHRLYGSMDVYHRYTDGALAPAPNKLETGLSVYYANIIDMSNRGVEFQLGGDIIRNKNFTWNSEINLSSNRNRIEKLNDAILDDLFEGFIVGQPTGVMKGYVVEKIVQTQEEIDALNDQAMENGIPVYQNMSTGPGDYLYKDLDGNGYIDEYDREVITRPEPKLFGGWSNTFQYKNFSLSILSQFSYGGKAIWESLLTNLGEPLGNNILRELYQNTWTPENTTAIYPKLVNSPTSWLNTAINTRSVFDNSFFRVRNVALSYDVPAGKLEKLGVMGLQLNLNLTNLITFTRWPGLDPDISSNFASGMSSNTDPYPSSRTMSMGVRATF
ncbi:MAG: SusC/RagA family TonB-linked outer membrane protein [Bacteroidia bacterium]|nr:SusC/RagA family TonB-linked outer membrane protein [Bacteroidia bacterium]